MIEYDPRWTGEFEEEKKRILRAIGDKVVAIEHYGSTAVQGLRAKPIIDILIALRHLNDAKDCIEQLKEIGYEYRPIEETLTPGTRYFRKGPHGANTHHIRMVEANTELWNQYLLFRDYLRNHPDEAERYYELKKRLHARFGKRLPIDAKTEYIQSIVAKARRARETASSPGSSKAT